MQERKNQFWFRYFARKTVLRRWQTPSHCSYIENQVNLQQQHMFNTRATLSCRYLQSSTSASYFIPFFLSSSFLVIYTDTNKAKKTRIDPLISVLRARGNGSVNFRKFLASVRHDFAGFGYIGADLWNKICVLYYLLKSTTLSTSKFEICQHLVFFRRFCKHLLNFSHLCKKKIRVLYLFFKIYHIIYLTSLNLATFFVKYAKLWHSIICTGTNTEREDMNKQYIFSNDNMLQLYLFC